MKLSISLICTVPIALIQAQTETPTQPHNVETTIISRKLDGVDGGYVQGGSYRFSDEKVPEEPIKKAEVGVGLVAGQALTNIPAEPATITVLALAKEAVVQPQLSAEYASAPGYDPFPVLRTPAPIPASTRSGSFGEIPSDAIVLEPNSSNLVVLDKNLLDPLDASSGNPFFKKFIDLTTQRSIELKLSSTALGPSPTATINRQLVAIGQEWNGFVVERISAWEIFLRKHNFWVRIPVSRHTYTIKMP